MKRAAERLGLRVFEPEHLRRFVDEAHALGADAFVVASYGKIVPQALLDVVPIAFNIHPSLLPLYRGATPIQSAIRDGRTTTGVTIIAMDAGMDTGDVLFQDRTEIAPDETYGELHDRLAVQGAKLITYALLCYQNGTYSRGSQSDLARQYGIDADEIAATATRPLRKGDLDIDWGRTPEQIAALVRSLAPAPLARTTYIDEPIKVISARAVSRAALLDELGQNEPWPSGLNVNGYPGRELLYAVHGGDGAVIIDRLIAANRGPTSAAEFVRRRLAQVRARMSSGNYP